MGSGSGDRKGPAPGSGEGRDPLFGWREGEEAPAAPPGPVADHGAALAELATGQRRIVALLERLEEKMQADAGPDLAEMARTISEATEWTSNIRAGMDELFAATGRHIEGLKGGQRDLDKTAAALHGREAGLGKLIDRFDEGMKVLRGTMQRFEQRSSELGAVKQDLAGYYGRWTEGAAAYREKMDRLSERLDEGEHIVSRLHRELQSWTEATAEVMETHAATQRKAAAEAAGNVGRVAEAGNAFLARFNTGASDVLTGLRTHRQWSRRWTVPALAVALALACPSFVLMGAMAQSEFGIFAPHDDTGGWKQSLWDVHGKRIMGCVRESMRTGAVVRCSIDVRYP